MKVVECLFELLLSCQNEWSHVCNRLVKGLTGQQDNPCASLDCFNPNNLFSIGNYEWRASHCLQDLGFSLDLGAASIDHKHRVPALRDAVLIDRVFLFENEIKEVRGGTGDYRPFNSEYFTRNNFRIHAGLRVVVDWNTCR